MMEFSDVMNEITGGVTPICTMKEVAFQLGVSLQTAYQYRAGETEPSWSAVVRLSRYLITEYGYYRLAMQPTVATLAGKADGRVNDQLLNIYESGTDLHRAFTAKNRVDYVMAISAMEKELVILKQEGEAI